MTRKLNIGHLFSSILICMYQCIKKKCSLFQLSLYMVYLLARSSNSSIVLCSFYYRETMSSIYDNESQQATISEDFRALAENIPQLVWITRSDGYHEYFNQHWYDYTGTTLEQTRGEGWSHLLHPDDYERTIRVWNHSLRTGDPYNIEYRFRNGKTGEYRWFLGKALAVKDGSGNISKWFGTCTDIDDQKRAEEERQHLIRQLEAEQARLQEVFNQMPGSVIIAEAPSGKIIMGNKQVEDIFGHPALPSPSLHHYGEWVGFHLDSGEQVKSEEWPLARAISNGEVVKAEDYEYLRGDGTRSIIRLNAAPIRDSKGTIIAGVVTALDVTEQRELEQRKDEFISIASHELKTPITTIKALTQLLKRKLEQQGLTEHVVSLSKIETNVNKLTRLANDLLDVSKIQAGKLHYAHEPVDMNMLIQEAVETAQYINTTHKIILQGSVQKSVVGDNDRLAQVFMNLLGNAIKYSPQADKVEVAIVEVDDKVYVHVHDYGVGIPKEQHAKIFDRFYRVDGEKRTSIQGLGMGLYIACDIVKRHGGDITVRSEEDAGTTFSVILPLATENQVGG